MLLTYFLLMAYAVVARAQNSVPIATSPIVVTTTVPTVVQSLSTSLSVSTQVSNANTVLTQTSTGTDGNPTVIIQTVTGGGAQARILVTVTDVETIQVSTNTVIVSTIGSTTIFGPDTAATSTPAQSTTREASTTRVPETSTALETRSTSIVSISQAASSSAPHSTFAVASAPTTASSPDSSSSKGKGLSTGAKVGIALGSLLIVGFITFIVIFIVKAKRQKEDPYLPSEKEMVANSKITSKVGSRLGSRKKTQVDGLGYDPEDSSWLDRPYGELSGKGGQRYEMGVRRSQRNREHYRELDGGTNERFEMGVNSRNGPMPGYSGMEDEGFKRGSGIGWGRAEVEARKSAAGWQPGRKGP